MANEFKHKDPCTALTQAEYIGACGDNHVFACQATGDLLYADSSTVLKKLARASSGSQMLQIASCKPAWTATPSLGSTSWANMNHAHAACNSGGTVNANCLGGTTLKACVVSSSLTSVGTLGALTVDDVAINGKVVTMTGSACDTIVMTAAANGAFSLVTTDTAAAAANIQITADGTVDIDSAGVLTLDSGAAINIEPASGSAVLIDGTVSIDGAAITGATSILATDIKIGEDDQTKIDFACANIINLHANNIKAASIHNTSSKGDLRLYEGCNYVSITTPALCANWTLTLPANDGCACQVLQTNGSGVTSWAAASGGPSQSTAAQLQAETNNCTYAPPDLIHHSPGVAKAWININTNVSTAVNNQDYNVSSFNDCGVGRMKIHIGTDFTNAHYVVAGMMTHACGTGCVHGWIHGFDSDATNTRTSGIFVTQGYSMNSGGCAGENRDSEDHDVVFFGTLPCS